MQRNLIITRTTLSVTIAALLLAQTHVALGYEVRRANSGDSVHWAIDRVAMTLDPSLSLLGDPDQVEQVVAAALQTWQSADALPLNLSIATADVEVAGDDHELDGRNTIYAIDGDWPYDPRAPAVTILSYDSYSGMIIEADIAIDASRAWSLTEEPEPRSHDFQDIVTHEIGHALGLAHSEVVDATMFERSGRGSIDRRNLHDDDLLALVATYEGVEIQSADNLSGCSAVGPVGSTSAAKGSSLALFALVLGLAMARLRSSARS